jgi:hypothetical protein|tara:strand:+ start:878 stop:1030 length:153 start_codon:yes stop_codon:yes gene_type:complete
MREEKIMKIEMDFFTNTWFGKGSNCPLITKWKKDTVIDNLIYTELKKENK